MSEVVPHYTPCAKCRTLLNNEDPIEASTRTEYAAVAELLKAAESGCRLCAMVSGKIKAMAIEEGQWEYMAAVPLMTTVSFEVDSSNGMTISASLHPARKARVIQMCDLVLPCCLRYSIELSFLSLFPSIKTSLKVSTQKCHADLAVDTKFEKGSK